MNETHLKDVIKNYLVPYSSTCFVILLLYQSHSLFLGQAKFTIIFILFSLLVSILNFMLPLTSSFFKVIAGKRLLAFGFALICISILTTSYLLFDFNAISWRAGDNTILDFICAGMILIPVLLMAWKRGGAILAILIFLSILYMFFGSMFPGLLRHGGLNFQEFLIVQVLSLSDSGLLCAATQIVATWVTIFIVYAGLMQGFGAFDCILKGCFLLCRKKLSLVPQLPIFTSMLFGSISGAAAANVGATGSFTIPLMKRYSLPARLAGGIEAVASSGGQIMPPVMGATGFMIAMLLCTTYVEVMLRGFIPAILFYWVFAFGVYIATKGLIRPPPEEHGPERKFIAEEEQRFTKKDMFQLIPIILSAIAILFDLIYFRREVFQAALHGIIVFLAVETVFGFYALKWRFFGDFGRKFIKGATISASTAANVGVMVAGMALILKSLTTTALAPKISYLMIDIAGNSLLVLLILVWIICLLFGLAVSTLIVYLLVVVLAAPALQALGIPLMVSHFVIFYFGAVAFITPPTAPASLVASGIAEESFIKTSLTAVKIGIPLFILPFTFVTHPELIIPSSLTAFSVFLIAVAFMGISYSLNSRDRKGSLVFFRVLLFLGGGFISFHTFFYSGGRFISGVVALGIFAFLGRSFIKSFFAEGRFWVWWGQRKGERLDS